MTSRFVTTLDGSITAQKADLGELYHNRQGAYGEALLNYALPTMELLSLDQTDNLVLLDICFGMGYNTLVLLEQLLKLDKSINLTVTAVDNDPDFVAQTLPLVLEQPHFACFDQSVQNGIIAAFKSKNWQCFSAGKVNIKARLLDSDLRQALVEDLGGSESGLIYHDPFAPQKVPRLWTTEVFGAYKDMLQLAPSALFTYASASAVRGAMLDNGFSVYQTAKFGGKNGGTLATTRPLAQSWLDAKTNNCISNLAQNDQERLKTSSRVPYRDSHGTSVQAMRTAREVEQKQFLADRQDLLDNASSEQVF